MSTVIALVYLGRRIRFTEPMRRVFKDTVVIVRMPTAVPTLFMMPPASEECLRRQVTAELKAASQGMTIGERRRWLAQADESPDPATDVRLRFRALSNTATRELDRLGRIVLPERLREFDDSRVRLALKTFPFAAGQFAGAQYVELQLMGPRKRDLADGDIPENERPERN